MNLVVRCKDFSYAYPDARKWVLKDVQLEIGRGECHCLSGPTGSGKTTLGLALKDLLPPGAQQGTILFPPLEADRTTRVGVVLQNPEVQILRSTIGAEVAFGLENQGVASASMPSLVAESLRRVGLAKALESSTGDLSMGQKYRLVLASQMVMAPDLLVLDEPAGQLDPPGLEKLLRFIERLRQAGIAFLLLEHRPGALGSVIDRHWHLHKDGTVRPGAAPSEPRVFNADRPVPAAVREPRADPQEVIAVHNLAAANGTEPPVWSAVSFAVTRGQRVAVHGRNGTGKTTLLRCLVGFLPPRRGEIRLWGKKPRPGMLRGKVGCLFQNPQRQIFETTVFDEVAFPLKRFGSGGRNLRQTVMATLALCSVADLAEASPHKLSYGQKRLVALACTLVHRPELLLLDDPFAGLDGKSCAVVLQLLRELNEKHAMTLLWTCHDPAFLEEDVHQVLTLRNGTLEAREGRCRS